MRFGSQWFCGFCVILMAMTHAVPLHSQDIRLSARLTASASTQVQKQVDSARAEGLPTEPLIQKALEGQAKGAPDDRIVIAVMTLRKDLRVVRTALGPEAPESDLVPGVASLRAGASRDNLVELRNLRRGAGIAVPLGVLADLVANGMGYAEAWNSVRELATKGGSDGQFSALRDRAIGAPDPAALPPAPSRPRGQPGTPSPSLP